MNIFTRISRWKVDSRMAVMVRRFAMFAQGRARTNIYYTSTTTPYRIRKTMLSSEIRHNFRKRGWDLQKDCYSYVAHECFCYFMLKVLLTLHPWIRGRRKCSVCLLVQLCWKISLYLTLNLKKTKQVIFRQKQEADTRRAKSLLVVRGRFNRSGRLR